MFGSVPEKIHSACWTNRSRLEKFLFIVMGLFILAIIVLSSLVAAHYQRVSTGVEYSYRRQIYINEPTSSMHRNSSPLSTHVLDVSRGLPAANIEVTLSILTQNNQYQRIAMKRTDDNGRVDDLTMAPLNIGTYKIEFGIENYYQSLNQETFYPTIEVIFNVKDISQFYHIPLTLSPFGYSTYRGS